MFKNLKNLSYREQGGVITSVVVWGSLFLIAALHIAKAIVTSSWNFKLYFSDLAVLVIGGLIIIGVLSGIKGRRLVKLFYYGAAILGFIALIAGFGLDIEWMRDISFSLIASGLMFGYLLSPRDEE